MGQHRETAITLAELRQHIARTVMLDLTRVVFDTHGATLLPEAGVCSSCPNRTGNARMLILEVKQADICTLPSCYKAKAAPDIDVTLEPLKRNNNPAVTLSNAYSANAQTPNEALTFSHLRPVVLCSS